MDAKPPPYTVQGGYPPAPQTLYPDPPPPQQQTVIVQQPVLKFQEYPVTLPDGNVTILQYKSGLLTWIIAGVLCLFTGLFCIALIPFCIDSCKDVEHIHPVTGQVVGVYARI